MLNWEFINKIYLYDGTFDGLLTIAFDCYVKKTIPIKIVPQTDYMLNLLDDIVMITTDGQKSKRIWNGLYKNVSYTALYDCYHAFQSCRFGKELAILQYILNAFIIGPSIINMLSIDYVLEVLKLRKNVLGEAHRLKGLVRLAQIGENLYYSPIHPDNNVIENVGQFLMKRFPTQNFILHDKNRNIAFLYNQKEYSIMDVPVNLQLPSFSEEEKQFQKLWKTFFTTIAIKERTNKRLQMQYMPKKYWKDLTEFQNM